MKYNLSLKASSRSIAVFLVVLVFTACIKNQNTPSSSNIAVTSISPKTGPFNTGVVVKGSGFSSIPTNDSVFFNGIAATVSRVSDSELVVIVPKYAGTGPVTVKINGVIKTGPVFTYVYTVLENRYAGSGPLANSMYGGYTDGPAASAAFFLPAGLALDKQGNLYVLDFGNSKIREITPPGSSGGSQVSTLYSFGNPEGITFISESLPEQIAGLAYQNGVFFCGGNSPGTLSGGNFTPFSPLPNKSAGGDLIPFPYPVNSYALNGVAMDASGNLYAAIMQYSSIVTVYYNGPSSWADFGTGMHGDVDGTYVFNVENQPIPSSAPSFANPSSVVVDSSGNIYVADASNNKIRKITPDGVVSTFAGTGNSVESDGTGTAASFSEPTLITIDGKGNFYVADLSAATGNALRMITPAGVVTTLCTQCLSETGGLVVDAAGQNIYTTEYFSDVIDWITIQ